MADRDVSEPPRRLPIRERGRAYSRFFPDNYENVPELTDITRYEVFRKMRRSDPTVSAAIRSIELPILQGTFDITAPSDPTELEKEQAKLIKEWIFNRLDWNWILRSSLTALTYGNCVFEKMYERVDSYVVPRKLGFRPQRTLSDDERNNRGELTGIVQHVDELRVTIPRKKCVVITIDAESEEEWRGQSILRSAYKPWYIKEKMEIITGIAHERFTAGILVCEAPEGFVGNKDSDEWKAAEEALMNIVNGLNPYAMLPPGWKLYTVERKSQVDPTLPFIRDLKDDIKISVVAVHLRLGGSDASGSKALGVTFIDSFLHAVQAWGNLITQAFDRDLIRELVIYNWGVQTRYPRMTLTNVYKSALTELAYLIQTKVIKATPELIKYIFEQYGIVIDNPEDALPDGGSNDGDGDGDDDGIDNNARTGAGSDGE